MRKLLCLIFVLVVTVAAAQQTQTQWQYIVHQSIHGESKATYINLLDKMFPTQMPMLMFRNHALEGYGVVMGFNTFSFQGDPSILVKFDSGPIETYQVVYINNFMAMHLLKEDALKFIAKAEKAKQVIVEHNIFNMGKYSFQYDLRQLNLNRIK